MCCRTTVIFLLISHKPQLWSWNWICRQKAHELSFPTIRLPNGNVIKFSHTNREHFTVGDALAFPIVKMKNKTHKSSPSLCTTWTPIYIQQCLGPPYAPPQTKVPIGYSGAPQIRPQKYPFPWTDSQSPLPASFHGPVRPMMPNGIRIQSAVFRQCTGQTDARTHRQIVHGKVSTLRL